MAQYIDKAAVVAEIKAHIDGIKVSQKAGLIKKRDADKKIFLLKRVLSLIENLEVKEVDLEKELIKWHKEHFKKDRTFIGMSGFYLTNNSQMDIAKHFFELGLKAQKGEEV